MANAVPKDIATELETTEQTIRTQLNRHKTWFVKDAEGRWSLILDANQTSLNQTEPAVYTNQTTPAPYQGGFDAPDMEEEAPEQ